MKAGNVPVRASILALMTGLVFSVGPATVDLSLPAMPAIQRAVGTATVRVELTLTLLLASLAIGQLVFGTIADRYGRRMGLLVSLAIYSIGALLAASATNLAVLAIGRVVQAIGFGVAGVVVRCAVTDVCDERRTAAVFSTAIMMVSVASVVAPAAGGALSTHWGWRAVFLGMAAFGGIVFVLAAALLPETLPAERRSHAGAAEALGVYGSLLRNPLFVVPAAIAGCAAAFQFAYNTGAPAALIEHYGISPARAGVLFSMVALTTAVVSQANVLLLKWFSPERLTGVAVRVGVLASVAVLISAFAGSAAFVACLCVLIGTLGLIMGNTMAAAISSAGAHAGAASALVGVMQFVFGTAASMPIGISQDTTGRLMAVVLVLLSLGALILQLWGRRAAALP